MTDYTCSAAFQFLNTTLAIDILDRSGFSHKSVLRIPAKEHQGNFVLAVHLVDFSSCV